MVEIRNYQNSDFPAVKEILEKGGLYWDGSDNEKALDRKIQKDPDSILVAVEDERVVGTQLVIDDFMPFLFRLSVHPEYRGKGIGTELLQRGEKILRARGHNHINILVDSDDTELQNLYVKQGYEKGHKYQWMTKEF